MTLEIAGRTMFSSAWIATRGIARFCDGNMASGWPAAFLDLVLPLSWPTPQDFSARRFRKRWTQFVAC